MRTRLRSILACGATAALVMAGASGAIADDITNDITNDIISPTKLMTLAINGSGTTVLSIDEKNEALRS